MSLADLIPKSDNPDSRFNLPGFNWHFLLYPATLVLLLVLIKLNFGINDAGERTVIQFPTGTLLVKFTQGIYFKGFGNTEVYRDVITFNFDKQDAATASSLNFTGILVRYQDGGTGRVFGKTRFALPNNEEQMIHLHKDFRSNDAVGLPYLFEIRLPRSPSIPPRPF